MAIIHNNENGFTLVELLVSILIFAIGVAALTQTLIATIRGNNLGNRETTAMTLAYDQLEALRGIDPSLFDSDVRLTVGVHKAATNVVPQFIGAPLTVASPAGYFVSYTVTSVAASGALFYNNAKQVDVSVTWADPQSHTVSISSVIVPNI